MAGIPSNVSDSRAPSTLTHKSDLHMQPDEVTWEPLWESLVQGTPPGTSIMQAGCALLRTRLGWCMGLNHSCTDMAQHACRC
jgi:hypothetical protein